MSDLVKLEDIKAPVLFGSDDEVKAVIKRVEDAAKSFVFDVSTAQGRSEAASIANKVARSKTFLDSIGKEFVSDLKEKAKIVDQRRKTIRDTLDEIKAEVRKPLTEYEEKEKARVKAHSDALEELGQVINLVPIAGSRESVEEIIKLRIDPLKNRDFEENQETANSLLERINGVVDSRLNELDEIERQRLENERLKKEAAEREQKEREERIAREAAEKARKEADEQRRKEEEARLAAEQEKLDAERRELEAIKQAEADKKAALENAKKAEEEAEKRRIEAIEEAKQKERARLKEEQEERERQAAEREADVKHRTKINNSALDAMVAVGATKTAAKAIVTAIAKGEIPNVSISY